MATNAYLYVPGREFKTTLRTSDILATDDYAEYWDRHLFPFMLYN